MDLHVKVFLDLNSFACKVTPGMQEKKKNTLKYKTSSSFLNNADCPLKTIGACNLQQFIHQLVVKSIEMSKVRSYRKVWNDCFQKHRG